MLGAGFRLARNSSVSFPASVFGKSTYSTYSTEFIRSVFSNVARKYDLMNDLMSLGIHRCWKDIFVKEAVSPLASINNEIAKAYFEGKPYNGQHVVQILDLAGGTGDIAFRILEREKGMHVLDSSGFVVHNSGLRARADVTVMDPSVEMTDVGERYAAQLGLSDRIKWINAPAEKMPLADDTCDIITVAFGVRNFSDRVAGLKECFRVLKPGGRLLILEFSHCESDLLKALYESYSNFLIPTLGKYMANDESAYQYLIDSIRNFPNQQELADMLTKIGYDYVAYRNLTGGIVAIHSAFKPQ